MEQPRVSGGGLRLCLEIVPLSSIGIRKSV